MRRLSLLLLFLPELAVAMPWWIEQERAPALSDALDSLWPGHEVDVLASAPAGGDGIWWADGRLFFREGGQLRSDAVGSSDLETQVLLARAWADSVEVLDGGWLPPALSSERRVDGARTVGGFLRVDAAADLALSPTLSLGGGLAFQRARAGVRLSTAGLGAPLALSVQVSAWLPAGRWAVELGGGPGLLLERERRSPLLGAVATVWAPDLDGNRVGLGLSADLQPAALPQLKDAFAIRAEVSWSFGPTR